MRTKSVANVTVFTFLPFDSRIYLNYLLLYLMVEVSFLRGDEWTMATFTIKSLFCGTIGSSLQNKFFIIGEFSPNLGLSSKLSDLHYNSGEKYAIFFPKWVALVGDKSSILTGDMSTDLDSSTFLFFLPRGLGLNCFTRLLSWGLIFSYWGDNSISLLRTSSYNCKSSSFLSLFSTLLAILLASKAFISFSGD